MRRISDRRTGARTGKLISYLITYGLDGTTGNWGGEVLLLSGKRHKLAGGVVTNVTSDTIGQAANQALDAEVELLTF